jgi:hypothetical protein
MTREILHRLVDELPESEWVAAERFLRFLAEQGSAAGRTLGSESASGDFEGVRDRRALGRDSGKEARWDDAEPFGRSGPPRSDEDIGPSRPGRRSLRSEDDIGPSRPGRRSLRSGRDRADEDVGFGRSGPPRSDEDVGFGRSGPPRSDQDLGPGRARGRERSSSRRSGPPRSDEDRGPGASSRHKSGGSKGRYKEQDSGRRSRRRRSDGFDDDAPLLTDQLRRELGSRRRKKDD